MTEMNDYGASISSWSETRATVVSAIRSLFGQQFAADDEDANAGKFATIITDMADRLNEKIQYAVSAFDPDAATGTAQKKLVKMNGMTANEGLYSVVPITITANAYGTKIYAGDIVCDPNDKEIEYALDNGATLGPYGSDIISATCKTRGKNVAGVNTLTYIKTPRNGWSSATNETKATPGQNEETPEELRRRRDRTSKSFGKTTLAGIWSALSDLDTVEEVYVHQNLDTLIDAHSVPPRNLLAIVAGGNDNDIAEVLFKTSPLQTYGDVSATFTHRGHSYIMWFKRPTDTTITVTVNMKATSTTNPEPFPTTGEDEVKQAAKDWSDSNQKMGIDAIPQQFARASSVIEGYYVDSILINGGSSVVSAAVGERLIVDDLTDVTVNVV